MTRVYVDIDDAGGTAALIERLDAVSSNLIHELRAVVTKVANKAKSHLAKEVVKQYSTTQKQVRKATKVIRVQESAGESLVREVSYKGRIEWPVKYVKHRHTKAGVAATPLKNGQQAIFPKGFKGPKPGKLAEKLKGHAFQRKGKERKPIEVIKVAGPVNIMATPIVAAPVVNKIAEDMLAQLTERIRYKTLVAQGKISGRTV